MATLDLSLTLSDDVAEFLRGQVAEGGYASPGEYVGVLIREARRKKAKAALDATLVEALEGPAREMTEGDWAELRRGIIERSPELGKPE